MNVTVNGRTRHYRTVSFDARRNRVLLIEQRLLPHQFKVISTPDFKATAVAIRDMIVRGAGAIGATAAYGLAQGARAFKRSNLDAFEAHVGAVFEALKNARPTAVDPVNAMLEVRRRMSAGRTVPERQRLAERHRPVHELRRVGQRQRPLGRRRDLLLAGNEDAAVLVGDEV